MKIRNIEVDPKRFPRLVNYGRELKPFTGELVNKEEAVEAIFAIYEDELVSNVTLLAPPGTGKTTLMRGLAYRDKRRAYVEVEVVEMISGLRDNTEMGAEIKNLFGEVTDFVAEYKIPIVIFIDEFHQIVELSSVATEAFKPVLADSAANNLRIVMATTYEEFRKYIAKNQALVERSRRVSLQQPRKEDVIAALEDLAKTAKLPVFRLKHLFETIFNVTERYMPSENQPRKSLLTFSAMIGFHRAYKMPLNEETLAYVLRITRNLNINFQVDLHELEDTLRSRVFSQDLAIKTLMDNLVISVMRLNDQSRPRGSFLFTGPTGSGKTELVKTASTALFPDPNAFVRFDMSEYALETSLERFRRLVTTRIWEHPFSCLLLDEIEKAHPVVIRLLLQVLDDGRLTDEYDRVVPFNNCFVFLTTNLGAEIYNIVAQYEANDTGDGEHSRSFMTNVKRSLKETSGGGFPPELISRVDAIVPFQALSRNSLGLVLDTQIRELVNQIMRLHNKRVLIDKSVLEYLTYDVFSDQAEEGARQVRREIAQHISSSLGWKIYDNPQDDVFYLVFVGRMRHGNKTLVQADGHIEFMTQTEYDRYLESLR